MTAIRRGVSAAVLAALVVMLACGGDRGVPSLGEGRLGSRLATGGDIADSTLVYTFRPYTRGGTVKDLFNFFYFEGDTVCFSFPLTGGAAHGAVKAVFVDSARGISVEAERLEVVEGKIYGFSLVGSLMEKFFHAELAAPAPGDGYSCKDIPFEVRCTIELPGGAQERRLKGAFRIEYRDAK
ncbi:MAG: hypothetical protein EPN93_12820 [Spirochaetes bacterium]|nr:MAG: hypothetical protein EPN93_12820 [Spirochaetota bacterium]